MDGYSAHKSADALPMPFRHSLTGSVPSLMDPWRANSQSAVSVPSASSQPGRVDLAAVISQSEQQRLKLAQVEKALSEVTRKLDDWVDVTKSGLESLRSEMGAVKLEHRFSQTLRSTNSRVDSREGTPGRRSSPRAVPPLTFPDRGSPDSTQVGSSAPSGDRGEPLMSAKRLDAVEAACQDLRINIQEVTSVPEATERLLKAELNQVVGQLRDELQLERTKAEQNAVDLLPIEGTGAELQRRVEETERRMQELQQDHLSETVAVKGRLEVAVRECDKQLSRADEVQSAFKAELMEEVNQLRDKLQLQLAKVEEHVVGMSHVEAQNLEMSRRLEESDRKLWEVRQAQTGQSAESSSVRSRLEVAVRECQEQIGQAEALRALLQEEKDRRMSDSSALLMRVEAVEQAVADAAGVQATTLLSRLKNLEDSRQDVQRVDVQRGEETSAVLQHATQSLRLELQKEVERLRDTVDRAKADCFHRVEERSAELSSRMQEVAGVNRPQVQEAGNFQKLLQEAYANFSEACRQETAALTSRLDVLEHRQVTILGQETPKVSASGTTFDAEVLAPVLLRMDKLEALQRVGSGSDDAIMASVLARLEDLEASQFLRLRERIEALEQRPRPSAETSKDMPEAAVATVGAAPPDMDELRRALAATSGDVACLARDLASVREEHDAAITGIGGLTEFVARAAATSIQRTEERLAEELATKREEFEKAANAQREALGLKAQAMLAEAAANLNSAKARQANAQTGSAPMGLGHLIDKDGNLQLEEMSKVDVVAVQLRAEAAAQTATSEARIAAAEAVFSADMKRFRGMLSACVGQLEAAQVDVHDLRPRVAALEAAVASRDRKASGAAPTSSPGQSSPSPWANRQLLAGPSDMVPEQRAASPRRAGTVAGIAQEGGLASSPLRGSYAAGSVEAVSGAHAWLSTFQKVMKAQAPSPVLPSDVAQQYPTPGQRVQEGLKDKLEGIVSSVHQVLGALNLQQRQQPESASPLGSLGQPLAPGGSLLNSAQAAKPLGGLGQVPPAPMQRDPSAGMPGLWGLPMGGAAGGGGGERGERGGHVSPIREQSPFRRVVPQDMGVPQAQQVQPHPPSGGSSLLMRSAQDEAASLPSRMPLQAGDRRLSPESRGNMSPPVAGGAPSAVQMQAMRGRSQDSGYRLSQTWNGPQCPQGQSAALGQRPSVGPMTSGLQGPPVAGMANTAAAALAGAHPGVRDRQVRASRVPVQAVSSPVSNAGSVASAKNSTKGLATRPPPSNAGSTASVRSSARTNSNIKL